MKGSITLYIAQGVYLLLWFTSCSTGNAAFDYDKEAPFETYFTFNFITPDPEQLRKAGVEHPEHVDIFESAIEEQMALKGYKRVLRDPDLRISYFVKVKNLQKANTTGVSVGTGSYGYGGGGSVSVGTSHTNYIDYKEGTVIIDLIDAERNLLVWEGIGDETYNPRKDNVADKVYKVVDRIFYSYQFQAGQGAKKK